MKPSENPAGNRVVRKIQIRAAIFLGLALLAGTLGVILVKTYLDSMQRRASQFGVDTTTVVVAAMDLPIATSLTEKQLSTAQWPKKFAPQGSFTRVADTIGRTVRSALLQGEVVLEARLADKSAGRGLPALLSIGTRAMAVKVDQVIGVAGFVQPGNMVDVITIMKPDEQTRDVLKVNAAKISRIILQNVKVLAIGEQLTTDGTKPVKVQVVTLEVTAEESERLALASRHGEIQLTIRSELDQEVILTPGASPVALLAPDGKALRSGPAEDKPQHVAARGGRKPEKKESEKKPEEPKGPIVEILRGGKVDTRQLRPSADSGQGQSSAATP